MAKLRRLIRGNRGQGLVEFALVLPVLILLLFGIVEFGRIFNVYLTAKEASREGARLAIMGNPDTKITEAVTDISGLWDSEKATITISPSEADRNRGEAVKVTISYEVDLVAPMISAILPDPFPVTGSTVMRME